MSNNLLEIKDLRVSFKVEKENIEVLSGINLDIEKGQIVGVVGESGCGKTLTALSVMGLLPIPPATINSGEVIFDNNNLLELDQNQLRGYRGNRISMIFQEPISSLNPVYTIGDQIGEVIRTHKDVTKIEEKEMVIELLNLVGIPSPETRFKSYPHEMSGGMCQRVMIAMALACKPELLIADEPTTALDVTIQAGILKLIKDLREKIGMAVLFISHDLGVISQIADEIYVLYAGKVVEKGSVNDVFSHPTHPYTIGLIKSIPNIEHRKDKLYSIPGVIPSPNDFPKGCRFNNRCEYAFDECYNSEPRLEEISGKHESACFKVKELIKNER
ncbi:MAG: ATP-binding cassette domain-containing protein [Candidatus Dadabacteria bacterium]|nr:ATP-binding cassette domain-containing protein [Candidatus Dadabacteria bacterium]NIQ13974.1 ATP-binding cassette domain-containing protein [Candidatus Dadabacteria bacterium]